QGLGATDAREILVLLPVLHPLPHHAGLVWLFLKQPAIRGQIGPQPIKGLAAEAATLLGIALVRVLALAATSEGGRAACVVAVLGLQVIGQLRLGGEGIREEANRSPVTFLVEYTEQGEFDSLLRTSGFP